MKKSKSLERELDEVITKHIAQELEAEKDDALTGYPFQVLFATDHENNVKVTVRWPSDAPPANTVRTIALMLNHISTGNWKQAMASAVKKHGLETKQTEVTNEILCEWNDSMQVTISDNICVPPTLVFKGPNQIQG